MLQQATVYMSETYARNCRGDGGVWRLRARGGATAEMGRPGNEGVVLMCVELVATERRGNADEEPWVSAPAPLGLQQQPLAAQRDAALAPREP